MYSRSQDHNECSSHQDVYERDEQAYGGELPQRWGVWICHVQSFSTQLSHVGNKCAKTVSTLCRNTRRRTIAAPLLVLMSALAFSAAPALAAAPEAPVVTVESITTTAATLHGILNPGKEGAVRTYELGTYEFLYRPSGATPTECEGGSATTPGASFGGGKEELPAETLTGLAAGTEYTVCLRAKTAGGTTLSSPVTFTTVPVPHTEVPSPIGTTTATFKGKLTPLSSTVATEYFFYYNLSNIVNEPTPACTDESATAPASAGTGTVAKAVSTSVIELQPNHEYTVCLVSVNAFGLVEDPASPAVTFKTLAAPPEVVLGSESSSPVSPTLANPHPDAATEVRLNGTVNPNNQITECHFQYGTDPLLAMGTTTVPCEPASLENFGGQGVGANVTGLSAGTVYHYRVVAKNLKGEEEKGTIEEFETLAAPTGVQTTAAEEITGTSANLGGKLDAGGEARYYVEYGIGPCGASSCGAKSYELGASGKVQECVLDNVLQECVTPIVVDDLQPLTTYHYWLVATNAAVSTPVHGAELQFTTGLAAPTVQTGVAEDLTPTSASLTGMLAPGGEAQYYFEYGTEPCGNSTCGTATAPSALSGATQQAAGPVALSGLAPNMTYYYWLVASNAGVSKPVDGEARQFTTPKSGAEEAAEAAAKNQPEAERAAVAAAQQRLEAQARQQGEAAAAANAARNKQYEEVGALTATLEREEAEAAKKLKAEEKTKPKPVKCKKGKKLVHGKCVERAKSKQKAKGKTTSTDRRAK
jgi:hypothetical protein